MGSAERPPRIVLVRNPTSGSADGAEDGALIEALGGSGRVTPIVADTEELGREVEAAAIQADLVVAAGGDGTLHATLHALGDATGEVRLGVIPMGTGNDFATALGMPSDPIEAARSLLDGRDREIDVAVAEGADGSTHRFLNASIGGFPVAVDDAVSGRLKRALGAAAYTVAAAKVATDLPRFTVTIDGYVVEDCIAAGVGNGPTVGGGIPMWPDADPGDGLLDGCAVPAGGVFEAVEAGLRVRRGTHGDAPDVVTLRAPEIRIDAEPQMEMNLDGELAGVRTPVVFRLDGTLTMRVPAR
jgi:diacylglycerol kinase (ATP)